MYYKFHISHFIAIFAINISCAIGTSGFAKTVRTFAKICETPKPTAKRWYYNAIKYNKERHNKVEKVKEEILETAEKALKTEN